MVRALPAKKIIWVATIGFLLALGASAAARAASSSSTPPAVKVDVNINLDAKELKEAVKEEAGKRVEQAKASLAPKLRTLNQMIFEGLRWLRDKTFSLIRSFFDWLRKLLADTWIIIKYLAVSFWEWLYTFKV